MWYGLNRNALKDKIEETRKDFREFKEKYSRELEEKFNQAIETTEEFSNNKTTPHSLRTFMERLEAQMLEISQTLKLWEEEFGSTLADTSIAAEIKKVSHYYKVYQF